MNTPMKAKELPAFFPRGLNGTHSSDLAAAQPAVPARQYIGTKLLHAWPALSSVLEPGYAVRYENGYESWSPRREFESVYSETNQMTFGQAMEALRLGHTVARFDWEDGDYLLRCVPSELTGTRVIQVLAAQALNSLEYVPTQPDMLAEDWQIVGKKDSALQFKFTMQLQGSSLK